MPENELTLSVHSLIHKADEAMCSTSWDEMIASENEFPGGEWTRKCPQCKAAAFRVDQNPAAFCKEAENLRSLKLPHKAYRRLDGTYTFTDKNCSPKKMFSPVKSDLRGVAITNWWSDRYGRYNKFLFIYGLVVGGTATVQAIFTIAGGVYAAMALGIFVACAIGSALIANIIFGVCILVNLAIPGFLGPARKYAGPVLLGISMFSVGWYMTGPLLLLNGNIFGRFFPGLQG